MNNYLEVLILNYSATSLTTLSEIK